MILKTLDTLGPLHGYGIARRIEQISGDRLSPNYGTLYPSLLKLEQEGWIAAEWGVSENNRKAKYYKLTRSGRKQLSLLAAQPHSIRFLHYVLNSHKRHKRQKAQRKPLLEKTLCFCSFVRFVISSKKL